MIEMACLLTNEMASISPILNNTSLNINITPTTDWNLVFVTLFLGICALAVPPITKWVEHNMYAPKLEISFNDAPPYCHKTMYEGGQPVYYFRLLIKNIGKSKARNCEVILEKIWTYENETPKEFPNFSPVNLIWVAGLVGTKVQYIEINPNRSVFCDIGHIASRQYQRTVELTNFIYLPGARRNHLCFLLEFLQVFNAQPNCLHPGKYILDIGIYSENAKYQKARFEISWSGEWKDSENEMFREINIQIGGDNYPGIR
jgi:hypothetical protein